MRRRYLSLNFWKKYDYLSQNLIVPYLNQLTFPNSKLFLIYQFSWNMVLHNVWSEIRMVISVTCNFIKRHNRRRKHKRIFVQTTGQCQHRLLLMLQEQFKAPSSRPMPLLTACLLQCRTVVVTGNKEVITGKNVILFPFKGLHKLYSLLPVFISKLIFLKSLKTPLM